MSMIDFKNQDVFTYKFEPVTVSQETFEKLDYLLEQGWWLVKEVFEIKKQVHSNNESIKADARTVVSDPWILLRTKYNDFKLNEQWITTTNQMLSKKIDKHLKWKNVGVRGVDHMTIMDLELEQMFDAPTCYYPGHYITQYGTSKSLKNLTLEEFLLWKEFTVHVRGEFGKALGYKIAIPRARNGTYVVREEIRDQCSGLEKEEMYPFPIIFLRMRRNTDGSIVLNVWQRDTEKKTVRVVRDGVATVKEVVIRGKNLINNGIVVRLETNGGE